MAYVTAFSPPSGKATSRRLFAAASFISGDVGPIAAPNGNIGQVTAPTFHAALGITVPLKLITGVEVMLGHISSNVALGARTFMELLYIPQKNANLAIAGWLGFAIAWEASPAQPNVAPSTQVNTLVTTATGATQNGTQQRFVPVSALELAALAAGYGPDENIPLVVAMFSNAGIFASSTVHIGIGCVPAAPNPIWSIDSTGRVALTNVGG